MRPNKYYLPIINAPIVVSKEMQEYFDFYNTLEDLVEESGSEKFYVETYVNKMKKEREEYLRKQNKELEFSQDDLDAYHDEAELSFRLCLVHQFEGTSYRSLHTRVAGNFFLQNFCGLCNLEKIVIPSKSELHRMINFVDQEGLKNVYTHDLKQIFSAESPYDPGDLYVDGTCIKADMHAPVDWLFICDGVRTMMKAVKLIRKVDIKNRMNNPETFITAMNKLAIKMSAASRTQDAKKKRKAVLREMKTLEKIVRKHAEKHLELFKLGWEDSIYTEGRAKLVIDRLKRTIDLMAGVINQAHERIIGERLVANKDKIISLYQDDVQIIGRKKIAAETEFGNQLFIAEQKDGFIVDAIFCKDKVKNDSKFIPQFISNFKDRFGSNPESICGDRGFSAPANSKLLEKKKIFNAIVPKSVPELQERMKEDKFRTKIKRRGPNEGRIAIYKSKFSTVAKRAKGFDNRHKGIFWGLISHNLFKWAKLRLAQEALAA